MEQLRLHSISPALAGLYDAAPVHLRRKAASASARAAAIANFEAEFYREAMSALDSSLQNEPVRLKLAVAAERFDDEYFELGESEDSADRAKALILFKKARAASALAYAVSEDESDLHEAIYEALMSLDDQTELVDTLNGLLSSDVGD